MCGARSPRSIGPCHPRKSGPGISMFVQSEKRRPLSARSDMVWETYQLRSLADERLPEGVQGTVGVE